MKKVIEQVVSTLPRKDGNGWKLQKTHELLHLPHFTSRFGHPQNYDSGPGESALKQHAKKPARTSQKRSPDEFIRQVSSRIDDVEVIQRFENITGTTSRHKQEIFKRVDQRTRTQASLRQILDNSEDSEDDNNSQLEDVVTGLIYKLWDMSIPFPSNQNAKSPRYTFCLNDPRRYADTYPNIAKDTIASFVIETFRGANNVGEVVVQTYSEAIRTSPTQSTSFRSHFNFQSRGEWYDWALVNWEEHDVSSDDAVIPSNMSPCKILAIFQIHVDDECIPTLTELQKELTGPPLVLLHCTTGDTKTDDPIGNSVLTRRYFQEYSSNRALLRVHPIGVLEELVLVVENRPGVHEQANNRDETVVRLCLDRQKHWSGFF